jgi:hypothetical protein
LFVQFNEFSYICSNAAPETLCAKAADPINKGKLKTQKRFHPIRRFIFRVEYWKEVHAVRDAVVCHAITQQTVRRALLA